MTLRDSAAIAGRTGIGLRAVHVAEVIATRPAVAWFEVHAENYLGGGPAVRALARVRADYPVAVHAVGLSPGNADGLDREHLRRVRALVERLEPCLVSEHLAWSRAGGAFFNDLLPVPLTEETLGVVGENVDRVQEALGRRILVENPSSYLRFRHSTMGEAEFLAALVARTGCGLLLDVNNLHVTSVNLGLDASAYLDALPAGAVGEIHLAGHAVNDADGRPVLIDDHGARVAPAVWRLFEAAVRRVGPQPALVEWDTDIPPLAVVLAEARTATRVAHAVRGGGAHARPS
jgi:uncharacterized protein (UPF0276 family)